MQLRKAARSQVKLRIGFSSPSGWWKTYSSLRLAYWMVWDWSKVALIDSENWSWDLYSSLWDYNILPLEAPFSPEKYIEAIDACEKAWMEIIIIDSISHEWEWEGWCLDLNTQIANAKFKGNTWAAWSVTWARHQKFLERITNSKCHIITTVRNKTETANVDWRVKKVWTKELTREGFEYELTMNFNLERDSHKAIASKDRTWLYIDRDPFLITEDIWKEILEWNNSWERVLTSEEKQQEESRVLEEKQSKKICVIFDEMKLCWDQEQIELILSNLKEELKKDPQLLNKDQLSEIVWLKNDMIQSFESKEKEKPKTTTKKAVTKKTTAK